jgi:tRNA(His) 5'-end guanylyltransferase
MFIVVILNENKKMKLSDRIKDYYEDRTRFYLMRRMITIIRLDGKGFSKYTKKLNKPFDDGFSDDMNATAAFLCENIQGAKFAYTQSDEISIILTDFDTNETAAWFDNNIQKMVSIAASMATAKFNQLRLIRVNNGTFANETYEHPPLAMFDARVFQVPSVDEMINAMILRQQDATRNSISMAAYHLIGDKLTRNISGSEKQEMLFNLKGVNWNDYRTKFKRGAVVRKIEIEKIGLNGDKVIRNKWETDLETPIFTQDKDYLRNLIPNK